MTKRSVPLRDTLEEEIVMGVLRPGDRLEEATLAARFGVSRTPIREVLHQLTAAGLVEDRPRRGAVVARIGPRRLVEMFDVMAELEAMCARLAARRATNEEISRIRAAHRSCEVAWKAADNDLYYYENETFHERIREAGRNSFLCEQADALQRRLRPYRRLQLRNRGRVKDSFDEHASIVEAMEIGDADAASKAMRFHVAIQGERFTDLLASLEAIAG